MNIYYEMNEVEQKVYYLNQSTTVCHEDVLTRGGVAHTGDTARVNINIL